MRILIINSSNKKGGAAHVAQRMHKTLLEAGIYSIYLDQEGNNDKWLPYKEFFFKKALKKKYSIDKSVYNQHKTEYTIPRNASWDDVVKIINIINPDIVHLYWICGGKAKIEDLSKINKPIVWSMLDMWPYTGGCHYVEGCNQYTSDCGKCKSSSMVGNRGFVRRVKLNYVTDSVFNRKKTIYSKLNNLTIVGLSKWITDCSKNSTLFKDKAHFNIPNSIDTNFFKPIDNLVAREKLGITTTKHLVAFGAMNATNDKRKGFKELSEALGKLNTTDNNSIEFVVFGNNPQTEKKQIAGIKTHYLGYLNNEDLISLYSAADVLIVPSLYENLSNVILEGMSCGIPVVGFNIGGNKDMISHKKTGYLAKPYETGDLADGISWVLNNSNKELRESVRLHTVTNFDNKVISNKYYKLYQSIIN